jgi:hypothetical protein
MKATVGTVNPEPSFRLAGTPAGREQRLERADCWISSTGR